jgi:hypothetical protein
LRSSGHNVQVPALDDAEKIGIALQDAFVGRRLTEFAYNAKSGLVLRFSGLSHHLRITAPFSLGSVSAANRLLSPGMSPATEQLIPMLEAEVTRTEIDADGALSLTFTYVTTLRIPSAMATEAWQVRSDEGLLIISGSGGEITLWEPPTTARRAPAPR